MSKTAAGKRSTNSPSSSSSSNRAGTPASRSLNIGFLHPDLGIGGAERLIVDSALGLQNQGHNVVIYTSHHDRNHCFAETKPNGGEEAVLKVKVHGDWLPRHILYRFHVIFAILRMYVAAICMLYTENLDVIVVDQVSAVTPILKFGRAKILFYGHFPDKLLSKRDSWIKKVYRWPVDWFEEITTRLADVVVVNSKFTASEFKRVFKSLKCDLEVLYPALNLAQYDRKFTDDVNLPDIPSDARIILSINRFERKKNLILAMSSFAILLNNIDESKSKNLRLVIAGGYDSRVSENVEYLNELRSMARKLAIENKVSYVPSFSEAQRKFLLDKCICLLYTPSFEHFGIGPLEGMYAARPVIAVNNGGPLETVKDGETGYLCASDAQVWAEALEKIVSNPSKATEMGKRGRAYVSENFSLEAYAQSLNRIVLSLVSASIKKTK